MKISVLTAVYPTRQEPARGTPIWATLNEFQGRVEFTVNCSLAQTPRWIRRWIRPRSYLRFPGAVDALRNPSLRARSLEYLYLPGITRPINGRLLARAYEQRAREERPDVLLAYRIYPDGFAAVKAAESLGIPAVIGSRGSDLKLLPPAGMVRSDTIWAVEHAAAVLCVSQDLAAIARSIGGGDRVYYVRNGVDQTIFSPADRDFERGRLKVPQDRKLVVFTGNLEPVKGIATLIRALGELKSAGESWDAALIGEGGLKRELELLASEAGVGEQVAFLGARSAVEIAQWLNACDVFCLPSLSEGMPNVVLEALSCGRNVVATKVGGIPEIVDDTKGLLVEPGDSPALADSLRRSLEIPWDRAAIAASSRHSWAQVAAETLAICSAVVRRELQSARR